MIGTIGGAAAMAAALFVLHGRWIAQMARTFSADALTNRGYKEGMLPWQDPTFSDFARDYALCALALLAAFLCAVYWMGRRSDEQRDALAQDLDDLIAGRYDGAGDGSLLGEKKRQALNMINQQAQMASQDKGKIKQLVNDLSHQIKTPIASAKLHLELLHDEDLSADERARFLTVLGAQLDKISELSKSLVALARLETGLIQIDMQKADLNETVRMAASALSARAQAAGIELSLPEAEPMIVPHDRTWTMEVIVNAIDNALKYTPRGGHVRIHMEKGAMYAQVEVIDDGIGIDHDEINKVFGRFYRGDKARGMTAEGSGLGLTIARDIMQLQKGSIAIAPVQPKGTIVSISLLMNL